MTLKLILSSLPHVTNTVNDTSKYVPRQTCSGKTMCTRGQVCEWCWVPFYTVLGRNLLLCLQLFTSSAFVFRLARSFLQRIIYFSAVQRLHFFVMLL